MINEKALEAAKDAYLLAMGEIPWKYGLTKAIEAYEAAKTDQPVSVKQVAAVIAPHMYGFGSEELAAKAVIELLGIPHVD